MIQGLICALCPTFTTTSLSYTWENKKHAAWVKALAARLRKGGVETILDQWEVGPGDELLKFMEEGIRDHVNLSSGDTERYEQQYHVLLADLNE